MRQEDRIVRTYVHKKALHSSTVLLTMLTHPEKEVQYHYGSPVAPCTYYTMIMFVQVCIYNRYIMLIDTQIKFDFDMRRDDYDNDMR